MFIIILTSVLRHGKNSEKEGKAKKFFKKFIITFILAIMFGIGWIFGVLGSTGIPRAISYPCQIAFVIIVGFQGLLVFILHPCRSKEAREEWSKWFYYLTCRSQTYKDRQKQSKISRAQSEHSSSANTRRTGYTAAPSSNASTMAQRYGATIRKIDRQSSIASPAPSGHPGETASIRLSSVTFNSGYRGGNNSLGPSRSPSPGFAKRRSSEGSVLGAAGMAARFGFRCPSDPLPASSQKLGDNLPTPGSTLRHSSSPSTLKRIDELPPPTYSDCESLDSESQRLSKTPPSKRQMRQLYIFANNEDQPLTFGSEDADSSSHYGSNMQYASNDNDLMCFSPESSEFFNFEEEGDGEVTTWKTFEYDDELQSGATTLFYNFEDDF